MSKRLITAALVATGFAIGLAPPAQADINREVCLAVMAMGVDPYNPSDTYALNMLQRYPDMTYNQANELVKKAFGSVRWHSNPMCDGITIPENY
ncbi:hypothetical protein NJB1507_23680 [Mycobacterium marinum]|uniref:hypothetical protein n=1 Tax=Mycobacterium marinum TaxID=1781 RepID=UPI0021C3D968|nr:hypothetical protein [Mycobacterium marinum]GJO23495.1 hypothetical protein NJB1507_23680 [Mycobacterium marinum]